MNKHQTTKIRRKTRSPLHTGVAKTSLTMQMEATECGAACLTMILSYYGKWIPLEQIRADCGVSRDGANAKNVVLAARRYALEADGYRYSLERLQKEAVFPCIIYWNFNHFIVLNGFRGKKAYLSDPAKGKYTLTMDEFEAGYSGVCLIMKPGPDFVPEGKPKSVISFVNEKLLGCGKEVFLLGLLTALAFLFEIIKPGFSSFFIDRLLGSGKDDWLLPFALIAGGIFLLQILTNIMQSVYSLRVNGKLDIAGSSSYMWHVLHLPVQFFDGRMMGDLTTRKSENADVTKTLVQTLAPLLVKAMVLIVYLCLMIKYSPILSAVGILSVILKVGVASFISQKRMDISRVQKRDSGNLVSTTLSGISMIETIKAAGAEGGYFAKWSGYQAAVNMQKQKYTVADAYLGLIPTVIGHLCDIVVLGGGVLFVMNGDWTLGTLTAFQGILQMFITPANDFVSAGQTLQEMRTSMERIDDVMKTGMIPEANADVPDEAQKLEGGIELKDVCFGYSRLADPLLTDFCLTVPKGQSIAIVGASGSGKSTLTKLITGLYAPWSGKILYDGRPGNEINHYIFMGSVTSVDQDVMLFPETIAYNIKMGNQEIEDFEMILAARDACIHDEIAEMPFGYETRLSEGGKNLSGGQRQRLEIARALAQNPSILVMDEATSALDAKTEYQVMQNIRDRGITTVLVAHRLSTVRDCDRIIVLDHGTLVEAGTHDELIAREGYYYRLVSSN